jgi:hypothetical protein
MSNENDNEKLTHQAVNYRLAMSSAVCCAKCAMYIKDTPPGCTIVQRPIRPQMVCKLFEPDDTEDTTEELKQESQMPPVSERQRRAMAAAAAGKSTLGIPKRVGAEFVAADKGGKLPARAPKKGKLK